MFRILVFGIAVCIFSSTVLAQTERGFYGSGQLQSDWYGRGVHQFFQGQYEKAVSSLTTAIAVSPTDPRPYYFRGLAKQLCNAPGAGDDDFRQGAYRESYKSGRASTAVNRSLERIQGCQRYNIERFRREARFASHAQKNPSAAIAQPVFYGDVIDVNSIIPIIENVVPNRSSATPIPLSDQPDAPIIMPTDTTPQPDPIREIPLDTTEESIGPPSPEPDDPPSTSEPDSKSDDNPFGK